MYEKIRRWLALGLWTRDMACQAWHKGLLTAQQYENILEKEESV